MTETPGPGDLDSLGELSADLDLDREVSEAVERQIATPETRDRRLVQDHSGLMMIAKSLQGKNTVAAQKRILGPYDMLKCDRCNSEKFAVACSATDNYLAIVCANKSCGAMWPVLEMTPVQMNDRVARDHGLYIPDRRGTSRDLRN